MKRLGIKRVAVVIVSVLTIASCLCLGLAAYVLENKSRAMQIESEKLERQLSLLNQRPLDLVKRYQHKGRLLRLPLIEKKAVELYPRFDLATSVSNYLTDIGLKQSKPWQHRAKDEDDDIKEAVFRYELTMYGSLEHHVFYLAIGHDFDDFKDPSDELMAMFSGTELKVERVSKFFESYFESKARNRIGDSLMVLRVISVEQTGPKKAKVLAGNYELPGGEMQVPYEVTNTNGHWVPTIAGGVFNKGVFIRRSGY